MVPASFPRPSFFGAHMPALLISGVAQVAVRGQGTGPKLAAPVQPSSCGVAVTMRLGGTGGHGKTSALGTTGSQVGGPALTRVGWRRPHAGPPNGWHIVKPAGGWCRGCGLEVIVYPPGCFAQHRWCPALRARLLPPCLPPLVNPAPRRCPARQHPPTTIHPSHSPAGNQLHGLGGGAEAVWGPAGPCCRCGGSGRAPRVSPTEGRLLGPAGVGCGSGGSHGGPWLRGHLNCCGQHGRRLRCQPRSTPCPCKVLRQPAMQGGRHS